MSWRCSGHSNTELITNMQSHRLIQSSVVAEAFKKVDRANYVRNKADAYMDAPQTIGHGATISAPHMHAHATETLLPFLKPGCRVLDVGSGSGYTCAIFHHLVSPEDIDSNANAAAASTNADDNKSGKVIGIDHIPELVSQSVNNLRKDGLESVLDSGKVEMVVGDGRLGYPSSAPYDAIHVGAASPGTEVPQSLIDQLATPGRMFIPIGDSEQAVYQVDKDSEGNVSKRVLFGVSYVPLTNKEAQLAKGW